MTVTANPRRKRYASAGGTTTFGYNFQIYSSSNIDVWKIPVGTVVPVLLTLTTDYTVTNVGNINGGNVELVVGITAGDIIAVVGVTPESRSANYTNAGSFQSTAVNTDFDVQIFMLQQQQSTDGRTIRLHDADAAADLVLPLAAARANKYIKTDASGDIDLTETVVGTPVSPYWEAILPVTTELASMDALMPKESNAFYVSKDGLDTNDGTNPQVPFLTISAALTAAGLIAGAANRVIIRIMDGGIYTETLTLEQYVCVDGNGATLTGVITAVDDSSISLSKHIVGAGETGLTKSAGAGSAEYTVNEVTITGNGIGILNTSGTLFCHVHKAAIATGGMVGGASTGHVHYTGDVIHITSTGIAIGSVSTGTMYINIQEILKTGAGTGTAILLTNGTINAYVNEIDTTTAYNNNGGVLNLICLKLTGTPTHTSGTSNVDTSAGFATLKSNPDFTGTEAIGVAGGTTGERPGTPVEGDLRKNTTTNVIEYYNGTSWKDLTQLGVSQLVQAVRNSTTTPASTATNIPLDNTIPQITEGAELLTVTITPTNVANDLYIQFNGVFGTNANFMTVALFQDATANALSTVDTVNGGDELVTIPLTHFMAAGTTGATTFRIRYGVQAGTAFALQAAGPTNYFGGTMTASLRIFEIQP